MHARHRSPANGYRSNAMGMGGVATASRISPEGSSMRGHGFYSSEYGNCNRRGLGLSQGRQFQQPQPPPHKGDVFLEAGKLATEYLVSKGLLPPNALAGKWQNGNLKNQVGYFQSVRSQEGDALSLSADGRTSALSRLGNAAADIGAGRRMYFDEHNPMGARNYMGERRRSGSYKNYGSDWNREMGRSGSWSRRTRDSLDMEGYDDTSSGHKNEKQVGEEGVGGLQNFPSSEEPPESDNSSNAESALERNKSIDDADAKTTTTSSDIEKILVPEADMQPSHEPGDVKMFDAEGGQVKDENNSNGIEEKSAKYIAVKPLVEEGNQENKKNSEFLRLCQLTNVPTKTHSILTNKSEKFNKDPVSVGKDTDETQLLKGSKADLEDALVDGSSIGDLPNPTLNSKDMDSDVKIVPSVEEEQDLSYASGQGNCINPITSSEESLMQEQEGNDGLSAFGRSSSMFMERGEKRVLDVDDSWDAMKKPREWAPSFGTQSDGCLNLSNSMEKPQTSEEPMTSNFAERPGQKRLLDMSLFPEGDISCVDYAEEKKLFPRSFKTCDLNLMEASEANENYNSEPIHLFPSMTESGKQPMPVDIDLATSNDGNATEKYGISGSHGKDIEVIDLENDSAQEKAFNGSERRAESVFTGLDGFPNNSHNSNEIPDVQDGYGLMLSELLGNDMPNCSSVPPNLNSLHNDMSLPNGEGILGDDDSIYMSLGEIPISLLRVWEQPTQDYGKPF